MDFFGLNLWGLILFIFLAMWVYRIEKVIFNKTRLIRFWIKSDPKTLINEFKVLKNLKDFDERIFGKLFFFVTYMPNTNTIFVNDERITKIPYLSPLTYSSRIDNDLVEIKLGESKNKKCEIKFKLMFRRQTFPKPHLFTGYFVEEDEALLNKPVAEKIFDFPVKLLDSPLFYSKLLASKYGFEYKSEVCGPLNNTFDEQQYDAYLDYSFSNKYVDIGYQDS